MIDPLFIRGMMKGLGLGQQVIVGATLLLLVTYLFRGKKYASRTATFFGKIWFVSVVVGLAVSVVIFTGWADPNPSKFINDLVTAGRITSQNILDPLVDSVFDFLGRFIEFE